MGQDLADRWWLRCQRETFHASPAFTDGGLVLGRGTLLLRFPRASGPALHSDAGHDRLLALIAVAARGQLPADQSDAIAFAADQWRRGDRALAAIRLAFTRLPRLASPEDAYPLFLAETALDAGLSPRELVGELCYGAGVARLLKGGADQPRVPSGSGPTSGRWTSGSSGASESSAPTTTPQAHQTADHGEASVIPVFLAPQHGGEEDKHPPTESEPIGEAIQHGHEGDVLMPRVGPIPIPMPFGLPTPRPRAEEDDKDGPACPAMANDVSHPASDAAKRFEAMIARLVNPTDPTPKQTPETPNVTSQAYFLPQPAMPSGQISYDDCKRTNEPSLIVGMRKGDMVDARNEGRSFVYYYRTVRGFQEFRDQVLRQDSAVDLEGKGRRVWQCVGTAGDADHLTTEFEGELKHTIFAACHL